MNQANYNLIELGWSSFFEESLKESSFVNMDVGRVSVEHRERYIIYTESGELTAEVTGKLLYSSDHSSELPKVGDWVIVTIFEDEQKAIIHDVLPRRTKISRKSAGITTDEQIIAANVDKVFIVQGLDDNFNLRRLERYLVMVRESSALPVILLNKTDLCEDAEEKGELVRTSAPDAEIFTLSALTGNGLDKLRNCIEPGETILFSGSSGVGKSTIINGLAGTDLQKTSEVRIQDSRGTHTTTHRELFILPDGGILIDTPGMRELGLWNSQEGLEAAFEDIEEFAKQCHFADCTHTSEIKCAVLAAVEDGTLQEERLANYQKMNRELRYLETKTSESAALQEKQRIKKLYKGYKNILAEKQVIKRR